MSRLYEALCREQTEADALPPLTIDTVPSPGEKRSATLEGVRHLRPKPVASSRLVTLAADGTLGAEKFRVLATRLQHMQGEQELKRVLVTSPGAQEGKTLVTANLGIALSKLPDQKVLLVEGDVRKPALMHAFGLPLLPGLVEHVETSLPIAEVLYQIGDLQLWILPAGAQSEDPLDTVQSPAVDEALKDFSRLFTWIVIDSPPLLPIADTNVWARRADGILLVVREGKTSTVDLKQGLAGLDNANVVAVVLNACTHYNDEYIYRYGQR